MTYDVRVSSSSLRGSISAPPSKSLLHRAIICAALSHGKTRITPYADSEDIRATLNAIEMFGADYTITGDSLTVHGVKSPLFTKGDIDVSSSASTLRFLVPLFSLAGHPVTFVMSDGLASRPQTTYDALFKEAIVYEGNHLSIHKPITAGVYHIVNPVSSQFISGLLFTLPLLDKPSKIIVENPVSRAYITLTIGVLKHFGITIDKTDDGYTIPAPQAYKPKHYHVEGDYSQAAFFLCAGLFHPRIQVTGLSMESRQGDRAIIDILRKMHGKVIFTEHGLSTTKSPLCPIDIDIGETPDLAPALTLIMALTKGVSSLMNIDRLRHKESNRALVMTEHLNTLGAEIEHADTHLMIRGVGSLRGGCSLDSHHDHRIVMALAIAGTLCNAPLLITNAHAVEKSYPDFFRQLRTLGAQIELIPKEPIL